MLGTDAGEVAPEVTLDRRRQHRPAVLVALAASNHNQVGAEVHVLHAETTALEDAEAGAVEQAGHESRRAGEPLEQGPPLVAGENDWQALRPLGAHDVVEVAGSQGLAHAVEQAGLGRVGRPSLPDREGREGLGMNGVKQPAERW